MTLGSSEHWTSLQQVVEVFLHLFIECETHSFHEVWLTLRLLLRKVIFTRLTMTLKEIMVQKPFPPLFQSYQSENKETTNFFLPLFFLSQIFSEEIECNMYQRWSQGGMVEGTPIINFELTTHLKNLKGLWRGIPHKNFKFGWSNYKNAKKFNLLKLPKFLTPL